MPDLTDLPTVKSLHRIYMTDDDVLLAKLISAASRSIINYLKTAPKTVAWYDSTAGMITGTVPANVDIATAHLVGYMYSNPDSDEGGAFSLGNLPHNVTAILYQERDPALA